MATISVIVQIASEIAPSTFSRVGATWAAGEDLVDGVERRGADVAIDDAERADRQRGEPAARLMRGAFFARVAAPAAAA